MILPSSGAGKILMLAFCLWQVTLPLSAISGEAPGQSEWERTVKAAEQEGEVMYSASGSYRFPDEFHKIFPKIKTVVVSVSLR